jgi:sugar porter (SP) family MFS transporter
MKSNLKLFFYTFIAVFGGLMVGLNMGGIAGAIDIIDTKFMLSPLLKGFVTSAILVGCLFGALLGGRWSDKFGRKRIMVVSCVLLLLSAIGCALSPDATILIISRFIGGLGVGILSAVVPTYVSELSPARMRGTLVSFYQMAVVVGILIAYSADYMLLDTHGNWRLMLGLPLPFACIYILLLLFLPESPRWLIQKHDSGRAEAIIAKLNYDDDDKADVFNADNTQGANSVTIKEMFKGKTGKIVLLGSLLAFFQQITGINVVINYAPTILSEAGVGGDVALMQAILVGIVNLLFTVIAVWLVDRAGRKILLLTGCAGLVVSLGYLTFAFGHPELHTMGILIALLLYIAFFAFSLSPLMFVVTSEIYPTKIRGTAMALSTGISWVCAFIVVQFFPWVMSSLGGSVAFGIFAVLSLAAFLFIKIFIPETKGKSLEEIEKELTK